MISKTFGAALQSSAPVLLKRGQKLAISLSGTFVGTIDIQRLVKEQDNVDYPSPSDSAWATVDSYAAPVETNVNDGDNCWYRAYCSAYTSGSPVIKLKVA